MAVVNLNKDNFKTEVLESDKPVLVDFWAVWCGPCQMMLPVVDELAEEREDVKVCKVNVDEAPELAEMFGIDTIPSFLAFENGELKGKTIGAVPKQTLVDLIEK